MNVLFVSNYYPPEVTPPATRLYEHARTWVADGGSVEVLVSNPNFPEGQIYEGFDNQFVQRVEEGVRVTRVPMYVAENRGTLRRTLSYLSFGLAAAWYGGRVQQKPDVVAATSPQFFCALGGYALARRLGVPFVLEVRDLWPDSILAVGAMRDSPAIRAFKWLERFLYRHSDHIVVVTHAFKDHIVAKGIAPEKISIVKNGADLDAFEADRPDPAAARALVREHGMEGKFVAAYIGTIGMAHRADVLLEAAQRCADPDVVFAVMGVGAEREALAARAGALGLANFRLLPKQPRAVAQAFLAAADVSVVHLRDTPVFRTVLPSKLFDAMMLKKPIVMGVQGEARELVEASGGGVCIPSENPDALVEAVLGLKNDPAAYARLAETGHQYVRAHHDRKKLARRYWQILEDVARGRLPAPEPAREAGQKARFVNSPMPDG